MTQFQKFGSIEKFSTVLKQLNRNHRPKELTNVQMVQKMKLHGSNMAITFEIDSNGSIVEKFAQKRTSIITPEDDVFGFARWVEENTVPRGSRIHWSLMEKVWPNDPVPGQTMMVYVYGEWAGKGIQKKVAVSELDKRFYPFIEEHYNDGGVTEIIIGFDEDYAVFRSLFLKDAAMTPIPVMGVYEVDFSNEAALKAFVEKTEADVLAAEDCDPFIKEEFGVEGIGEGFVFYIVNPEIRDFGKCYKIKVKGDKHSSTSKGDGKTNIAVNIEQFQAVRYFVDSFVTDARVEQGINELGITSMKEVRDLLKWMIEDVRKESVEEIAEAEFDFEKTIPEINKNTAIKAREFFMGLNNVS